MPPNFSFWQEMVGWIFVAKVLSTSCLAWVVYNLLLGIYNLYCHPLARFPGPKAAAFSRFWKLYLEVFRGESLVEKLWNYHSKYGDIVRIGPNELHFSKPSVYNEIYNQRNRWTKDVYLYRAFAEDVSSFTMLEYSQARQRKDILLPLFSRRAIVNMQDLVQKRLDEMCDGIVALSKAGKTFSVLNAYNCFAMDTITTFCFARSMDCLQTLEFSAPMLRAMHDAQAIHAVLKHIPSFRLFIKLPESFVVWLNPNMSGIMAFRKMIKDQVEEVVRNPEILQDAPHPIIYHELLNTEHGRKAPTVRSLKDEAILLVAAGTETVSNASTVGTIHVLANPNIYVKLQAELRVAWPNLEDRPRYEALESLSYLGAVIKESLRLSQGVISPMTRVVPTGGATLSGEYIPGETVVGISNCFVHLNDEIFPNPYAFRPERWLEPGAGALDTYLVAFSKGPRSCLGINLGYCELYLLFANLFRRFDLRSEGVGPADLRWTECYLPHFVGPALTVRARPLED